MEKKESKTKDNEEKQSMQERFAALQKLRNRATQDNRKETYEEYARQKFNQKDADKLLKKKQIAKMQLEKELCPSKEDYERKRAWDWTAEESEMWDEKINEKKDKNDPSLLAERTYEKVIKKYISVDKPKFGIEKNAYTNISINNTTDQQVTQDNNELLNKLNSFNHKPSKEAINLVASFAKDATDPYSKKYKRRLRRQALGEDVDDISTDKDVTYINDKNKAFNDKLSRHYDKYTKETRDAFERGTAL